MPTCNVGSKLWKLSSDYGKALMILHGRCCFLHRFSHMKTLRAICHPLPIYLIFESLGSVESGNEDLLSVLQIMPNLEDLIFDKAVH
ncbi:hypothetical protein Sjap_003275 [Stephania japonica]|uniref:Uncharacterized protein n=1 Tax=Stephania japonica TaxID=461633 RepID=A0AAP0KPC9_9MAGN